MENVDDLSKDDRILKFFNKYHCTGEKEYQDFLKSIDPVIAITILVAAVAKAADDGIYNKRESEILANCVKKLIINDNIIEQ